MSIEAIQQVSQTEALAHEKKLAAQASAKQMVLEAEQAGQLLLEQTRRKAETEAREALAAAETRATQNTQSVLAASAGSCDVLCSAAEAKLDEAAALIVKRIVNV